MGDDPDSLKESTFKRLAGQLREFRTSRGWDSLNTPRNLAVSIAVETGELLEHFQWIEEDVSPTHERLRLEGVSEELADVVIYAIQLADVLGISLDDAIEAKMAVNSKRFPETRP